MVRANPTFSIIGILFSLAISLILLAIKSAPLATTDGLGPFWAHISMLLQWTRFVTTTVDVGTSAIILLADNSLCLWA